MTQIVITEPHWSELIITKEVIDIAKESRWNDLLCEWVRFQLKDIIIKLHGGTFALEHVDPCGIILSWWEVKILPIKILGEFLAQIYLTNHGFVIGHVTRDLGHLGLVSIAPKTVPIFPLDSNFTLHKCCEKEGHLLTNCRVMNR